MKFEKAPLIVSVVSLLICVIIKCFGIFSSFYSNDLSNSAFSLLEDIGVSIVAAYIFFLFQSYFYEKRRKKVVFPLVAARIDAIIGEMNAAVYELGNKYLTGHKGSDYTNEELHEMLRVQFDDETSITEASNLVNGHREKISMRHWLIYHADRVESEIDKIYLHFGSFLSTDSSKVFEKILHSDYHKILISYAKWNIKMGSFDGCNREIIAEYWSLRKRLEETKKHYVY